MSATCSARALQPFEYTALASPDHVRLLRFLDEATDTTIRCSLSAWNVVEGLSTLPPYAAISYVWGDSSQEIEIEINGRSFQVRPNCSYALGQVLNASTSKTWQYFWIDAICINQLDLDEKAHQVKLMGDIYSSADIVLGCLGPHSNDSEMYIDCLNTWGRNDFTYSSWDVPMGRPTSHFGARPYWQRRWILQEVLLAKDITFLCGDSALPLYRLEYLMRGVRREDPTDLPDQRRELGTNIQTLVEIRAGCWREKSGEKTFKGTSLWDALRKFRNLACQEPLDHVYALLRIVDWRIGGMVPIEPDYRLNTTVLALKVIIALSHEPPVKGHGNHWKMPMSYAFSTLHRSIRTSKIWQNIESSEFIATLNSIDSTGVPLFCAEQVYCAMIGTDGLVSGLRIRHPTKRTKTPLIKHPIEDMALYVEEDGQRIPVGRVYVPTQPGDFLADLGGGIWLLLRDSGNGGPREVIGHACMDHPVSIHRDGEHSRLASTKHSWRSHIVELQLSPRDLFFVCLHQLLHDRTHDRRIGMKKPSAGLKCFDHDKKILRVPMRGSRFRYMNSHECRKLPGDGFMLPVQLSAPMDEDSEKIQKRRPPRLREFSTPVSTYRLHALAR